MAENPQATLFPCPFSKAYGIPTQQAWTLLKVFLTYRFVLACLFIFFFYLWADTSLLTVADTRLFFFSSLGYLFITILSALLVSARLTPYPLQAQLLIFSDIVFLTLLMHACGGIKSGIGMLLAASIAAGGLLIGGRCSMLLAALASLAILAEQTYSAQIKGLDLSNYPHSGMLGAAFFTIALLAHIFAKQTEQARQISDQQQQTIVKLEDLNQYIIQHLQSGIIITDLQQAIQLANDAAIQLTDSNDPRPTHLADISEQMADAFSIWQVDKSRDFAKLDRLNHGRIHCRFTALPTQYETYYMVIIEDNRLYRQRLQQSKLASLGRLAASIAHEIRNPLSAISHAGQLLSESPQLPEEDRRLTEIIRKHCTRVNHIIEDILLLSRRSDSRRENIDLKPWLVDFLTDFLAERQLTTQAFRLAQSSDHLVALADAGHLRQILDNLCQNALRYGKPELGPITIRSFCSDKTPCIEVIDNGNGIDDETLKHLFEPFFTTSSVGTGLGLYICKELAELNQAKLHYYLTDDNRSCFQLRLFDATTHLIEI